MVFPDSSVHAPCHHLSELFLCGRGELAPPTQEMSADGELSQTIDSRVTMLRRTLVLYLVPVFIGFTVWAGYYLFQNGDSKSHRYRFDSFAPERNDCHAKWFVDGQDYMSAVADAIESASNEIFIADWQISPHIFMKRPDTGVDSLKWRLDKILLRKADQGIRVYILLYWESKKIAKMDHGSNFAQFVLKHHNIKVLLHPDEYTMIRYGPKGTGWWSHHEKVVVVDQSIAFVGGIDL